MKTKLFSLLVALCAISNLFAYDFKYGDLYYNIISENNKIVEVTYQQSDYGYDNYNGLTSVTIPASVTYNGTTYSVTSIGPAAFYRTYLTSITIPNSVTSIGESAFYGCKSLTSITLQNGVTSIGRGAFMDCTRLTSITIPNSVTSIGSEAFYYCSSLTSITIPNSVTSIGSKAFYGCKSLTSITIPNSVTSIGSSAFYNCTSLTSVTISNSVTSIGDYAFYCTGLTSITIPNSVTSIGSSAFYNCTSLTSVTIPNSVTSIGDWAFGSCNKLNQLIVLAPVPPQLGEYVFYGATPRSIVVIKCYLDDYQSVRWGGFSSDKYSTYKLPVSVSSADTTLGYTKSMPMDSLMDCGDSLAVQAYPSSTAPFAFWSDGSIDNPHTIAIPDSGINLKAYFAKGLACGETAQW